MVTTAHVHDVLDLTRVLSESALTRSLVEDAQDADDSMELLVSTYVESTQIRPAIAVLHTLQLAFDAASVVVEASRRQLPLTEINAEHLNELLRDPLVELTIIQLSNGSFFARFSVDPRKKHGRTRLLAIGGLAALAMSAVLGPIPAVVFEGLAMFNEIVTPDEVAAAAPTPVPLRTVDAIDVQIAVSVTITLEVRVKKA